MSITVFISSGIITVRRSKNDDSGNCRKTNMSTDTLRYYERIGLLPPVPRNAAGIRNYDEYFVNFINFIKKLKASGMSLEHIIDYIRLAEMGDATIQERKKLLAEARETLLDKINSLQLVAELADYQLRNYENLLQPETYALLNRHPASKALAI